MIDNVKISAAMIVKNESRSIIRCLNSLLGAVDECIIVDTGSTDNTIQLIQEFEVVHKMGIKIYNFEWINDFSAARNFALSKTMYRWKFIIDADEFLNPDDVKNLKKYCADALNDGSENIVIDIELINFVDFEVLNITKFGVSRLFTEGFLFERRIHEQLDTTNVTGKRIARPIRIYHDGYDPKVVNRNKKKLRNIKILGELMEENPGDYTNHLYFAREITYINPDLAMEHFKKAKVLYQELGEKNIVADSFMDQTFREIIETKEARGK